MVTKRQKVADERVGDPVVDSAGPSSSGADDELKVLHECFEALVGLCKQHKDEGKGRKEKWINVGQKLKEVLSSVLRRHERGNERLDTLLKRIFEKLQECMVRSGKKLDLMRSAQLDFLEHYSEGRIEKEISHAHIHTHARIMY